jgi:1-acyl-sn-glycerol-3-phosphate acyltransferase
MEQLFSGDSYSSSERKSRALSERIFLGTRWSIYFHLLATLLNSSALARRGAYDDAAWIRSSRHVVEWLESCSARFAIEGMDKMRRTPGPLVFVADHMSSLETLVLPCIIQPIKPATFVVNRILLDWPLWGSILRARDPIAISRESPREDLATVLAEGRARLASGISVIVFPQGTRSETWRRRDFNSLGVKLASQAGVQLMPIALKTDYWGSSGPIKSLGPIHRDRMIRIEFGDAMAIHGHGRAEQERCLDFIESRLKSWGVEIEES